MEYAKDIFIVMTIVGLVGVGTILSLQSGVVSMGRDRGRQLWSNASGLLVALVGCLAVLLMIQQLVGIRIHSGW